MRAVIFDIDGTLVQSMAVDCELYAAAIQAVIGPVQLRPNFGDYQHVTDTGILSQLFDDNALVADEQAIEAIRIEFMASLKGHVRKFGPFQMIPGAAAFIEDLKRSESNRVAIATGGWRESATLKLETSGFDVADLPLATADDAHSRVEIMSIALVKLGRSFESVTYFGDAAWDRKACRRLGWDFVAVGSELDGIESYDGFKLRS
jgi:phosphoglycolate phosphatase-like HAD superfamily hydrolase